MNLRITAAGGLLLSGLIAGATLPQAARADHGDVSFSFSVGTPFPLAAPVFVQPVPVYQPIYHYPVPHHYYHHYRRHHHHHHHYHHAHCGHHDGHHGDDHDDDD